MQLTRLNKRLALCKPKRFFIPLISVYLSRYLLSDAMSRSIVQYIQENGGSKCGYCKNLDTRFSQGMWGHILTPLDYQVS